MWGRVTEQIRKLALLYAISVNHQSPQIDQAAVRWATEFILHHTRQMLFMAQEHVADNPFHSDCLRVVRKLREAPNQTLTHSALLKRMKREAKVFAALIETLCQQNEVQVVTTQRAGSSHRAYRLITDTTSVGEA